MKKKAKFSLILAKYLQKAGVKHNILEHRTVYTAHDVAATMGRKLNQIAKSLLVVADRNYYLAILPADHNLHFKELAQTISKISGKKVKGVKIPGEDVMKRILKIKAGALGSFGGLYKLPVVIEKKMTRIKKAVFPSNSFNHSVEMAVKDFVKLEKAVLGSFGVKKK